jgi:hypothetical protein
VAFGDADNDGDQEVFLKVGGAFNGDAFQSAFFENPGHGGRWITLRLQGTKSNRAAIGARIRVTVAEPEGPRDIHVTVGSGGSFGASSLQQEIGLGRALTIHAIEVRWPGSGTVQTFRDVGLDRFLAIREGDPLPSPVVPTRFDLSPDPAPTARRGLDTARGSP